MMATSSFPGPGVISYADAFLAETNDAATMKPAIEPFICAPWRDVPQNTKGKMATAFHGRDRRCCANQSIRYALNSRWRRHVDIGDVCLTRRSLWASFKSRLARNRGESRALTHFRPSLLAEGLRN
jgi:hypothetical protein